MKRWFAGVVSQSAFMSLEKKSISITRLKLSKSGGLALGLLAWKEKYLDYEIETRYAGFSMVVTGPWKEKYLDYEIETYV